MYVHVCVCVCQILCQKRCLKRCQAECQKRCLDTWKIEWWAKCQNICPDICLDMSWWRSPSKVISAKFLQLWQQSLSCLKHALNSIGAGHSWNRRCHFTKSCLQSSSQSPETNKDMRWRPGFGLPYQTCSCSPKWDRLGSLKAICE